MTPVGEVYTMMDVNSMAERGGNEVSFHRHMKSMVAMEFG
jgi:hypothetical protein